MDLPGSSVHGVFQTRILEWVAISFSRGSSQPRDQTQVSTLQADSLPVEPQGKAMNTGVGSLSLLQGIFQTQRWNPCFPHWKADSFPLSHRGNPLKVKVSVAQLCPTLCNPVDCSPPGSSVHGILQARILEWVAISFSRGSSQPKNRTQVSCIGGRRFNL